MATVVPPQLRASWTIRYDCPLRDVPGPQLLQLLAAFRAIADELDGVGEASGVWDIIRSAELHVALGGWRFAYRIPRRGVLSVVGAHRIHESGRPLRFV
ncbi:MAG TPA: hypothetical protein VIR81_06480 [Myxococcales bacterium]|nr:hypothetical protein [Myxococcales bacterium]